MGIERVTHYVDNLLTQAEARMGLRNTKLLVAWYTNQKNDQSVVHSHPYHELVLPIGGSTVRYSIDGSVRRQCLSGACRRAHLLPCSDLPRRHLQY